MTGLFKPFEFTTFFGENLSNSNNECKRIKIESVNMGAILSEENRGESLVLLSLFKYGLIFSPSLVSFPEK